MRRQVLIRLAFVAWLELGVVLVTIFGGCGSDSSVGHSQQSAVLADSDMQATYAVLVACTGQQGETIPLTPPGVMYRPMVECKDGPNCCISPSRAGQEEGGEAVLPDTCDLERSWTLYAYAHEALHAAIGDACHTSPLWHKCTHPPFGGYPDGCTA